MWDLYLSENEKAQIRDKGTYKPDGNKPPSAKFIDDNNNVKPAVEELLDTIGLTHATLNKFLKRDVSDQDYADIIEALGKRHVVNKDNVHFWAAN